MKKIFTLLTFTFLTNGMLFGQVECADDASPNGTETVFNLNYGSQTERDNAFAGITSITFPAGTACNCGSTVTLFKTGSDPQIVTAGTTRIRGRGGVADYFATISAPFDIVYNLIGGGTLTCSYSAGGVLPVELISFDGTMKDHQINLTWETASEINNGGFVIERGRKVSDKLEWNQLDFVDGSGTTEASQVYSFTDQRPEEGTNYYRLKQMDYDGAYEYSSVVAVEYSRKDEGTTVGMFPNPVKTELTLTNGQGQATIYNALGQAVKQLTINANQTTIQLADLLNGQYYLQVLQADGTVVTKQFSKVN